MRKTRAPGRKLRGGIAESEKGVKKPKKQLKCYRVEVENGGKFGGRNKGLTQDLHRYQPKIRIEL